MHFVGGLSFCIASYLEEEQLKRIIESEINKMYFTREYIFFIFMY